MKLRMPRIRLSPLLDAAFCIATGLVSRKFVGAIALSHFRHQKAALRRSRLDSRGVWYSMFWMWWVKVR